MTGLTVPVPIPTMDGRLFSDGVVVMTYVEGGPPETEADWRRVGAHQLPEIGAFVARGEFALDYQPGPEWNEDLFHAFLAFVCALRELAPEVTITTEPDVVDDFREAFEHEVAQYCDRNPAI